MTKKLEVGEAGSKMQTEFERDNGLADKYLADANVTNLYELYHHRCEQLTEFGKTLQTMAEMYAGKGGNAEFMRDTPNAVSAMERVAIAAIELAKAVTSGKKP